EGGGRNNPRTAAGSPIDATTLEILVDGAGGVGLLGARIAEGAPFGILSVPRVFDPAAHGVGAARRGVDRTMFENLVGRAPTEAADARRGRITEHAVLSLQRRPGRALDTRDRRAGRGARGEDRRVLEFAVAATVSQTAHVLAHRGADPALWATLCLVGFGDAHGGGIGRRAEPVVVVHPEVPVAIRRAAVADAVEIRECG